MFGRLNSFRGRVSVNVFCIRPVADFNEITAHFCEVIYAHQRNLQATTQHRLHTSAHTHQGQSEQKKKSNQIDGVILSLQQKILEVVKRPEFANCQIGCEVSNIYLQVKGHSIQEIQNTIQSLATEGLIYSTVDEEHFKAME